MRVEGKGTGRRSGGLTSDARQVSRRERRRRDRLGPRRTRTRR